MKVLVATMVTQGRRKNDFAHALENELLMLTEECDGEAVDGRCGCRRSFSGLMSLKATTTAIVVDRPDLTEKALSTAISESYRKGGCDTVLSAAELAQGAADAAHELVRVAASLPLGAVVERRGARLQVRSLVSGAPGRCRPSRILTPHEAPSVPDEQTPEDPSLDIVCDTEGRTRREKALPNAPTNEACRTCAEQQVGMLKLETDPSTGTTYLLCLRCDTAREWPDRE